MSDNKVSEMLYCPICKTDELEDISPRSSNGLYGTGFSSWKTLDVRVCPNCRIVLQPKKED